MEKSKHTVTIPIEDYNKLVKAFEEYEGIEKIGKNNVVYQAIDEFYKQDAFKRNFQQVSGIEGFFDIYIKKL